MMEIIDIDNILEIPLNLSRRRLDQLGLWSHFFFLMLHSSQVCLSVRRDRFLIPVFGSERYFIRAIHHFRAYTQRQQHIQSGYL